MGIVKWGNHIWYANSQSWKKPKYIAYCDKQQHSALYTSHFCRHYNKDKPPRNWKAGNIKWVLGIIFCCKTRIHFYKTSYFNNDLIIIPLYFSLLNSIVLLQWQGGTNFQIQSDKYIAQTKQMGHIAWCWLMEQEKTKSAVHNN